MSERQAVLSKPRDVDQREGRAASDIRSELLKGVPMRARHLNVNGIATSVLEAGSGPPLVLLHGGIDDAGHVPHLEQPHEFLSALHAALASSHSQQRRMP